MNKPLSIRRMECIDGICSVINASGLPAFVVVEILERIYANAQQLMEQEYQRDVAMYQNNQEGENADNELTSE